MPLPAVVVPGVIAAVGRAAPGVIARAAGFLGSKTNVAIAGGKGLIEWAKRSPAGAAMVAASLVEAGLSIYELFGKDADAMKTDPETGPMMQMLAATASAAAKFQLTLESQADIKMNLGELGDQMVGKALVKYLKLRFHDTRGIKEAHMYERMFVELPEQTLDQLLAQYA